jgi:hypothetical protein
LLNAAVIKIGKQGSGIKTIMLPTKLISGIPRYPNLPKNAKRSIIILLTNEISQCILV